MYHLYQLVLYAVPGRITMSLYFMKFNVYSVCGSAAIFKGLSTRHTIYLQIYTYSTMIANANLNMQITSLYVHMAVCITIFIGSMNIFILTLCEAGHNAIVYSHCKCYCR